MKSYIKALVFAFIAIFAQIKPLNLSTEEVKTWSLKLMRAILNSKQ